MTQPGAIQSNPSGLAPPPAAPVVAGFAAIYLIWGSTFLAIRLAVETVPPFTMVAIRSVAAGLILFAVARAAGTKPRMRDWYMAALAGPFLFFLGHGLLAWSETRMGSGHAAVILATIPLWIPPLGWAFGTAARPTPRTVAGLVIGFAGVVFLVAPRTGIGTGIGTGTATLDPLATLAMLTSGMAWALGTVISRRWRASPSATMTAAMQLLVGGLVSALAGAGAGEWSRLAAHGVSALSAAGVAYLSVFGSLLAFGAYTWLLDVRPPAQVATYAFVNPVVALALGAILLGEPLGAREAAATAVILAGVGFVMTGERARTRAPIRKAAQA